MQGKARRGGGAEPFGRLEPARMRRAIVVAEGGDALAIKRDPARRGGERVPLGIGAEVGKQHVFFALSRDLEPALCPERFEIGNKIAARALAEAVVEMAQPFPLIASLAKGGLAAEPPRQPAQNVVVVARLRERSDRLMHRDDVAVARRETDIV